MNVTPIFKQIDPHHPQLKEIITASIGNPTAEKINTALASYYKGGIVSFCIPSSKILIARSKIPSFF